MTKECSGQPQPPENDRHPLDTQAEQQAVSPGEPKRCWLRAAVLVAGLIAPQVLMYWPSLAGEKILLPLDLLAQPQVYLPPIPEYQEHLPPHNYILSDQVLSLEISRRFCTTEIRAGRLPLWCPNYFLGAPVTKWPKYSPYNALYYVLPKPVTLAWIHLLKSLVGGIGAYLFFRRVLQVGFWAGALSAWCFPITGFLVLWQGFTMSQTISWFPWLLLAVDRTVGRPGGWGPMGLIAATALTLLSGQFDVAALALLAAGLFGLWTLAEQLARNRQFAQVSKAILALGAAWLLGIALAAPYLMPAIEYAGTGYRLESRIGGAEERPPMGIMALPLTIMPDMYGRSQRNQAVIMHQNRLESAATTYTGLFATLFLAILAWTRRRHVSRNLMWAILILISLSWTLNVPGLVWLLRREGLNLLSYNRFTFVASFAILSLAAVGLDALWRGNLTRRRWFVLPAAPILGLGIWSLFRSFHLPEPLASLWEEQIRNGNAVRQITTIEQLHAGQQGFRLACWIVAGLCVLTAAAWIGLSLGVQRRSWFGPVVGALIVADLLWYAHDVNPQCDRSLYYPPISPLQQLADEPPGRVLGYWCLPARLAEAHGLRDVRGYDGVDPRHMIDLMLLAKNPNPPHSPPYALTQWYRPVIRLDESSQIRLHPVLDMMNVRYLIFRHKPPGGFESKLSGDDHWIVENTRALQRLFVPARVEPIRDRRSRLERLASKHFNARELAIVEQEVDLPQSCRGSARILSEIPTQLVVEAGMETPGLLVLADLWDKGWKATVNGAEQPILQTNHALRGVVLDAGVSRVVFEYAPASFYRSVYVMCAAGLGVFIWSGFCARDWICKG